MLSFVFLSILEDNCIFSALIRKGAFAATPKAASPEKSRYVDDLPDESHKNPFFSQNFTPILINPYKNTISLYLSSTYNASEKHQKLFLQRFWPS
jgi:hypothetical protein